MGNRRSSKRLVGLALVVAAGAATAQQVSSLPSPLQSGETGALLLVEPDCADGGLGYWISDHDEVRRVEFESRDACLLPGVGVTLVPLGVVEEPIRRVQVVGCSFAPPGRLYCTLVRELPVLPTLFSSGFDALRYEIE